MLRVAITGGLSSGKSTVCHILKNLGAYVVSADHIVHNMLRLETKIGQKVISLLGTEILNANEIDRAKVAKKVFNSPSLLQQLEALLHPAVKIEIHRQSEQARLEGYDLFIAEIPLLFETEDATGLNWYDYIITVVATPELCENRFKLATGQSNQEFHQRSSRQMPVEEKAQRASFVIQNNGSKSELESQIQQWLYQIKK